MPLSHDISYLTLNKLLFLLGESCILCWHSSWSSRQQNLLYIQMLKQWSLWSLRHGKKEYWYLKAKVSGPWRWLSPQSDDCTNRGLSSISRTYVTNWAQWDHQAACCDLNTRKMRTEGMLGLILVELAKHGLSETLHFQDEGKGLLKSDFEG